MKAKINKTKNWKLIEKNQWHKELVLWKDQQNRQISSETAKFKKERKHKVLISKQDRGCHLRLCKHQKDKGKTTNKPTQILQFL